MVREKPSAVQTDLTIPHICGHILEIFGCTIFLLVQPLEFWVYRQVDAGASQMECAT